MHKFNSNTSLIAGKLFVISNSSICINPTIRIVCIDGNINHNEFRFHGWRGTTNNISVTACGVYEIKKVQELEDYRVKVTIGRKDLKKGEE